MKVKWPIPQMVIHYWHLTIRNMHYKMLNVGELIVNEINQDYFNLKYTLYMVNRVYMNEQKTIYYILITSVEYFKI